ncbi:MAG: ATP-binding protein [Sphaerochaetaceae bacterium]|nr:ATP-binding protein [Sphaerochaetaceae bacterium]
MKKKIKPIVIFILLLIYEISLYSQSTDGNLKYKIDNTPIVVACVKDSGYIKKISPTTYSGYLVDYLNKLGEYNNLHFKYILVENELESRNLVDQGIADIACLQYKTPNLETRFSYSNIQLTILKTNLYTLADNDNLYFDDFKNFDKMTIGIREDFSSQEELALYAKNGNFTYSLKYYPTETALQEALYNKEVVSIATDYIINKEYNLKKIGSISYKPTYIISKKGSSLIPLINNSIEWLHENDSNIFNHLKQMYLNNSSTYTEFTREEIAYIKQQNTLRVGLFPDTYIQSRFNKKTGEFEGIIVDYMKELEKVSHLKFEFVQIPHGLKVQDAIKQDLCDITPYLGRNEETLNDENIAASINYINMRELIAIRKDNPIKLEEIQTISCPANYQALLNHVNNQFPNWNVVKTNANNILDPLQAGIVDVAIGNEYEIKYLLQRPKYNDLMLTEEFFVDIILSLGISSHNNPILLSILNKSISNIDGNTLEYFKLKGLVTNYQYTFFDAYFTNSLFFNLLIFLLISVIIVLLIFTRYQKKVNEQIKRKEKALNLSNQRYEKANRAKTDFLAAMSHDLRTPMNAIIGLTELSKSNLTNVNDLELYIDKIDISAKYLLGLINDILDISAIEDGKLIINEEPFSLKELTHEVTSMYNVSSEQNNISFSSSIDNISYETLIGDYYRIKQIITNLLSNAFKFTQEKGQVELVLKETPINKEMIELTIIVKDTGIGISDEIQNKIFNKFVQADTGTLRKFGGSGLGLSIVKNLVELMNGKIELESKIAVGSTFKIQLPLKASNKGFNCQKFFDNNPYDKHRILVIDKDTHFNAFFQKTIKQIEIENSCTSNLTTALEKIKNSIENNNAYDIIFIDYKIKNSYDRDVIKIISQAYKTIPHYIVLTGYDKSYLKNTVKNDYINYYIKKPIFLSSINFIFNKIEKTQKQKIIEIESQNKISKAQLSKLRILLVEDNEINQLVGRKILESFGCEIIIANNGKMGFQTFLEKGENYFDIILMDIRMPIMDGYKATTLIRNQDTEYAKSIPIYAMTANVMKDDIDKSLSLKMNGHIAKPIDSNQLYEVLYKVWLDKNKN